MNENIIKSIQRVRDKDGNLVPVFSATSADMVYYDLSNEVTLKDKIDGGKVNESTYSYNNIYEYVNSDGGSGRLVVELPQIKDNTVEIDLTVNGGSYDFTQDLTEYHIAPIVTGSDVVGDATIREMSPNGKYIFLTIKRGALYTSKLYTTAGATVVEVPFEYKQITQPIRARFMKSSSDIIVLGLNSDGDKILEVHRLDTNLGSIDSNVFSSTRQALSGAYLDITYFDTVRYNGVDYMLTNTTETVTFACFRVSVNEMVATRDISTPQYYNIKNEIRTSNANNRIAILSADSTKIHCMSGSGGVYRHRSTDSDMDQYAWGGAKNGGEPIGVWTHFDFNPEGTRLYGTYAIDTDRTLRVCDVTATYGHYEPSTTTPQEITIHPTVSSFNIGSVVYRAIPNATIYGGTSNKSIAYVSAGTISSINGESVGPIIRCESLAAAQLTDITHSTSIGDVEESVYVVSENSLVKSYANLSSSLPITYKDIFIHPTSSYAYAIPENIFNIPIVPYYMSTGTPNPYITSSPASVPIYASNRHVDVSSSGRGIAYVDASVMHTHTIIYENGRYIYRNIDAARPAPNRAIACRSLGDGETVVVVYPDTIKAFRYINNLFTEQPIDGASDRTQESTTGVAVLSPTTELANVSSWSMCEFKMVDGVTTPMVYSFTYSEEYGFAMSKVNIVDSTTHATVKSCVFEHGEEHMCIVYDDADGVTRGYLYSKDGDTYTVKYTITFPSGISSFGMNTGSNCTSLFKESENKSILVYLNSDYNMAVVHIDWGDDSVLPVYDDLPNDNTKYADVGMYYSEYEKSLYIATRNKLYVFKYTSGQLTHNVTYTPKDVSGRYSAFTASERGAICVFGRSGSSSSVFINLRYSRVVGNVKLRGKYTDSGWVNVEITSEDPELKNLVAFGVNSEGKEVIIIGSDTTVWDVAHAKINNITIFGETASKYSYRIGYDTYISDSISDIRNITYGTKLVEESSNIKYITVRGIIVSPFSWTYDDAMGFYYYRIYDSRITPDSTVNVNMADVDSLLRANDAGMLNISMERDGYVEIYAADVPTDNLNISLDIFKSV